MAAATFFNHFFHVEVLEQHGVSVQTLGASIRGTVLCVSADNLGAHSLDFKNVFLQISSADFVWQDVRTFQKHEVRERRFPKRTEESHKQTLSEMQKNKDSHAIVDSVKSNCVHNRLAHFSTIKGFPPNFLHDLFEGILPLELSLCLKN